MKRKLLGCISLFVLPVLAQESPVLMRVNGREVSRSEFELAYRCHATDAGLSLSPKEFAPLFAQTLQKVEEAKAAGLDTTFAFREQQQAARHRLSVAHLVDKPAIDSCMQALYQQELRKKRSGRVQIMQVFFYLPQTVSTRQQKVQKDRMDSIYQKIKEQPEIDFSFWVEKYSDDKQQHWINSGQATTELEEVAFALPKGDVSVPFFTPEGIHLLKVMDRKEAATDEELVATLTTRAQRKVTFCKEALSKVVEQLKNDWRYVPNQAGIDELLSKGVTERSLFSIDEHCYTGILFQRFAATHPQTVKRQLEDFIIKSLFDYEVQHFERNQPELCYLLQQSDEAYLVKELTRKKIELPAMNDRAGLSTYFKFHSSDYAWETSRYKGIVVHCADSKTARQVKKMLKKWPEEEWKVRLKQTFGASLVETMLTEQGVFSCGDNPYIDKLVFKKGDVVPMTSYPFTVVVGKKQKGPEEYQEVIDRVRKDYQAYLENCWMRELQASGKVEINQEVLKTVNNN